MSRSNEDRLQDVEKYLAGRRSVTFAEIRSRFGVSTATARRDLDILEQSGKVQRIHGGALVAETAPPQLPVLERSGDQVDEKAAIGAGVAALIHDGETVFLSGGTTIREVAKHLTGRPGITVVTNSLLVINTLAAQNQTRLVILGGMLRCDESTIYGHFAEAMLAEIHVDKVILGARSISVGGGITNDLGADVSTERAVIQIGREVIVAADHTKFNRVSTVSICPLSCVHTIVTDPGISPVDRAALEDAGVKLVVVE